MQTFRQASITPNSTVEEHLRGALAKAQKLDLHVEMLSKLPGAVFLLKLAVAKTNQGLSKDNKDLLHTNLGF